MGTNVLVAVIAALVAVVAAIAIQQNQPEIEVRNEHQASFSRRNDAKTPSAEVPTAVGRVIPEEQ